MPQEQEQKKETRPPREGRGPQGAPHGPGPRGDRPAGDRPAATRGIVVSVAIAATAAASTAAALRVRPKSSSKS